MCSTNLIKLSFYFLISIIFFGCGRKQKNIFDFPDPNQQKKESFNVNKLLLPCTRGIKLEKTKQGNLISWQNIKKSEEFYKKNSYPMFQDEKSFLGYNIYKLVNAFFVPKEPLNSSFLKETKFLDKEVLKDNKTRETLNCYLVQAVFKIKGKIFKGPFSQIICDC
ncbi:hypothetical protein GF322_04280 [Candidatus Dependentiae bacterium]|nr:hypothetical protein [Candidatus Dependentiae bacterium]